MKQLFVFSALLTCMLFACGSPSEPGADNTGPIGLGTFKAGEPVAFHIDDTVHVCTDELAYAIVQVTDSGQRRLMLQHSCMVSWPNILTHSNRHLLSGQSPKRVTDSG